MEWNSGEEKRTRTGGWMDGWVGGWVGVGSRNEKKKKGKKGFEKMR